MTERGQPRRPLITAVVAALPEELAGLLRKIPAARPLALPGLRCVYSGSLAGRALVLAVTGDGMARASAGVERLLAAMPLERLVVVGVAGGLSPDLGPGALITGREVLADGGPGRFRPSGELLGAAVVAAGARPVAMVTASKLVVSRGEKAALWQRAAPGQSAAVDLESAT